MAAIVCVLVVGVLLAGCSSDGASVSDTEAAGVPQAAARTYGIVSAKCGDASATEGTGVAIGDGRVLTAAHVVIAASSVVVSLPDGTEVEGRTTAIDVDRDLALVQVAGDGFIAPEFVELDQGETATVYTRSRAVPVEVEQVLVLDVFEVRGTGRSTRAGYRLSGVIESGDSGSGLFTDGGLAGSVFATSTDEELISWATASSEIEAFLDESVVMAYVCDPEESKVVAVSQG